MEGNMFKKLSMIILSLLIVVCIIILFKIYNNSKIQVQPKYGLKIYNWNSALGGVNETALDKTKFFYSINLTNENQNTVFIKSIEPSVNKTIKNRILSKEMIVNVNKDIKHNETIKIEGEIIIDTKGIHKSNMTTLEPFITGIKVSTDETLTLQNKY